MNESTVATALQCLGICCGILLVAGAVKMALHLARANRVSKRLFTDVRDELDGQGNPSETASSNESDRLTQWLIRAGHRAPNAAAAFLGASIGCSVIAILLVYGMLRSGAAESAAGLFAGLPVVGPGLSGLIAALPFLAGIALAGLPFLLIQRDRKRRVEDIERDLPLVLELLSTLAEAGFGFESAIAELLRAQPAGRPLADEFRLYQLEVSAGGRRSESLGHLASRVDLASVSSFTSALRHGEETGASIAGLLRPQANLVRQRRRERALAAAEALPEKLVVPLLVGFLPGLLVWTLGPAFFQLFEMIDAALG